MKVITSQNGKIFITVGANQIWDVAEMEGVYSVETQGCSFAQYKRRQRAADELRTALKFIAYSEKREFQFESEGETD